MSSLSNEAFGSLIVLALFVCVAVISFNFEGGDRPSCFKEESDKGLSVYIYGAIQKPGKYRVKRGIRVSDLKELVRLENKADERVFNKKKKVKQGQVIYIPKRDLGEKMSLRRRKRQFSSFLVVLNSGSLLVS